MNHTAVLLRLAYAQGWAASGGPLTDQVRAGCTAAIDLCLTRDDDPTVFEVALHLGHLEGVWAAIYQRRDRLHDSNEANVLAAWKGLGLTAHTDLIVKAARTLAGLTEAVTDPLGERVSTLVLRLIATDARNSDELRNAVGDATLLAKAEGQAAGNALLADQRGLVGFNLDVAADDAYRALLATPNLAGTGEFGTWLTGTLGDAANEVGSKLAALTKAGASYEEMTASVGGLLDGASSRAVRTAIDVLTSRALSQGSLDLYRSDGITWVDFLTAGDGRVCLACAALAARNPYRMENAPLSGVHPFCRCAVAPAEHPLSALTGQGVNGNVAGIAAATTGAEDAVAVTDVTVADQALSAALGTAAADMATTAAPGLAGAITSGVARTEMLGGGMSADTSLATFNDGTQAVLKVAKTSAERPPNESTDAETLAAKLGQELGIRMPEVVRTADDTVYMGYVRDAQTGIEKALDQLALEGLADSVEGHRLGLFDLVVGNTDRNDGNWLLDASDQLWGIDHGMAFQVYRSPAELAELVVGRNPFAGRLLEMDYDTHKVIGGTRAYSLADIEHIRAALQRLEAEFTSLGRRSWFKQTMTRLNWLAKHAQGEGTLFR